jgi:endonuclease G
MEYLTRDDLFNRSSNEGIVEENDKRIDVFYEDNLIPERFRSLKSHFSKSGFDRGHLAAARNHKHKQEDLKMSYSLINVSPQVGVGFNRHYWNRVENCKSFVMKFVMANID